MPDTGQAAGMRYMGGDYYGNPGTQRTYDTRTKTYSTNYNWLADQLRASGQYVGDNQPLTSQQQAAKQEAQRRLGAEDFAREQTIRRGRFIVGQRGPGAPVGVEAAKAAEKRAYEAKVQFGRSFQATTPGEAEAIKKMLRSPTAQFASQEVAQRGYELAARHDRSFAPEQVRAGYLAQVESVQERQTVDAKTYFQRQASKRLGIPTYDPLQQIHEAQRKQIKPDRVYVKIGGRNVPFVLSAKAAQQRPIAKVEQYLSDKNVEVSDIIKTKTPAPLRNFVEAIDRRAQLSFRGEKPLNPFAFRNVAEAIYGIEKGAVKGVVEEPLTAATSLVVGGAIAKGAGVLAVRAPILTKGVGTGRVTSKISALNVAGGVMAGYYGADVASRISAADNRSQEIGKILSTEILPMAAGANLATTKLPELPYKVTGKRPAGVLLEMKDIYATPEKYIDQRGLIVRPTEGIQPEVPAFFAGRIQKGLTNIYFRPTSKQIPDILKQFKGQTEYVSTEYGSYLKITPDGKIGNIEKAYNLLSGKVSKAPLSERLPIRLERKIKIEPVSLKLGAELGEVPGIPAYTYDVDIATEILRGKGTMPSTPFGGRVKGSPERARVTGIKAYPQLEAGKRPLFKAPKQAPKTAKEFKSIFDEKRISLSESVRNILETEGVRVSPKQTITTTRKFPSFLKVPTMAGVATATQIKQQVKSGFMPKQNLAVAERMDSQVENIKRIFRQKPEQPTRQRVTIERRATPQKIKIESPIKQIFDIFKSSKAISKSTPSPNGINLPENFIKETQKIRVKPFRQEMQTFRHKEREQIRIKPQPKQTQALQQRPFIEIKATESRRAIRRKKTLFTSSYENQLEDFAKAHKKRGKFVWNINNQIPTLESLIG